MRTKLIAILASSAFATLSAPASAHVTLNPNTAQAKGFTEVLVRVPNETDNTSTTKIDIKFPPGFVSVSYEPRAGWSFSEQKRKLAQPVQTDDGPVTEEVARLTITGTGKGIGAIAPGQFMDFPLSVQIPDQAGKTLLFPTLQTYSDGKIVRWIAPDESADTPAPHLDVTEASAGAHVPASTPASTTAKPAAAATAKNDTPSKGLVILALVLGALGLLTGVAAFASRTRTGVPAA